MLHRHINQFLDYCSLVNFSIRSIQALTSRLNEFDIFLKTQKIRSIKKVRYRHLIVFAADFNAPSIHITKSRVWVLGNFAIFLLCRVKSSFFTFSLNLPGMKTLGPFLTPQSFYTPLLH